MSPVLRRGCALLAALALAACEDAPSSSPAPSATAAATAPSAASPPPSAAAAAPSAAAAAVATAAPAPEAPPESIAAQHVLVAYRGSKNAPRTVTRSKADAKKRAEEVLAKAQAGEDFSALVKTYSDDAGTVDRMGSLGTFKREGMVKPFSDAAFALKVNQVSEVVESPFGFHVIKRNQ